MTAKAQPPAQPVIFLAFANSQREYLDHLAEEHKQIRAVLNAAKAAGLCDFVERYNLDVDTLFDVFQQREYQNRISILHYGGHANDWKLLLRSAGKGVNGESLNDFLAHQESLQLVFLNACATRRQALDLVDKKIPAVVATSQAIDDGQAMQFARRFYNGLAQRLSIRDAFDAAKALMGAVEGTEPGEQPAGLTGRPADGSRAGSRNLSGTEEDDEAADAAPGLPWTLHSSAPEAEAWSLEVAGRNPCFGLPPLPRTALPAEPFLGLKYYSAQHAPIFFGRSQEIRSLFLRITHAEGEPVILLYGQSGAGKSSLLDAGLVPRLGLVGAVTYARRDKEKGLAGTLQAALGAGDATPAGILAAWKQQETAAGKPLVLILDQADEAFTGFHATPPEVLAFVALLGNIFAKPDHAPGGKLVLGYRKEFHAEMENACQHEGVPFTAFFLEPLTDRNAAEVITGLTLTQRTREKYNLRLDEGLAGSMAGDLTEDAGSPIAPVLQLLLLKMWLLAKEKDRNAPWFTHGLYRELKQRGTGLSDFLEEQLETKRWREARGLPAEGVPAWRLRAEESGLLLDLLYRHTTPLGTADTQPVEVVEAEYAHVAREYAPYGIGIADVLALCKHLYLLTDAELRQRPATRLAHDTIAPLIRQRFEQSLKPGQKAYRILRSRADDAEDNPAANPLNERELENVEKGQAGMRAWNEKEGQLIQVSRTQRDGAVRTRRRWRMAGVAAVGMVLASAVVAWFSFIQAKKQATIAHAQQLAAQSQMLASQPNQLQAAALLALESMRLNPSLEGELAIRGALDKMLPFSYGVHHRDGLGEVREVAFSPDSRYLVSVSKQKGTLVIVSDVRTREPIARLSMNAIGNQVTVWQGAGAGKGDSARFTFGKEPLPFLGTDRRSTKVTFSNDSRYLCFRASPRVLVWKWQTLDKPVDIKPPHDGFNMNHSYRFSFDASSRFVACLEVRSNDQVHVWDLGTGDKVKTYPLPSRSLDVQFAPSGSTLAVTNTDGGISLFDVQSSTDRPLLYKVLGAHDVGDPSSRRFTTPLTFEEEGGLLIYMSYRRGNISRLNLRSGQVTTLTEPLRQQTAGESEDAIHVRLRTINAKGTKVATFNSDLQLRILNIGTTAVWESAKVPVSGIPTGLAFCGREAYVAVISDGEDVKLYDSQTGAFFAQVPNDAQVTDVAASGDGHYLATADRNGFARVWRIRRNDLIARLRHAEEVYSVVTTADGTHIATSGREGSVQLWQATNGNSILRVDSVQPHFSMDPWAHRLLCLPDRTGDPPGYFVQVRSRSGGQQPFKVYFPRYYKVTHYEESLDSGDRLPQTLKYLGVMQPPPGYLVAERQPYEEVVPITSIGEGADKEGGNPAFAKTIRRKVKFGVSADEDAEYFTGFVRSALSPDGKRMAVALHDLVFVWDFSDNNPVARLPHGYEETIDIDTVVALDGNFNDFDFAEVLSMQFSQDNRYLVTVTGNYVLRVWDLGQQPNNRLVLTRTLKDEPVISLQAAKPLVVTQAEDDQLILMDFPNLTGTKEVCTRWKCVLQKIAFSADNRLLATVSYNKFDPRRDFADNATTAIEVWNTESDALVRTLYVDRPVHVVSFSPDGDYLLSGDEGGFARVWDLATGEQVSRLRHDGAVRTALFAGGGRILVTSTGPSGKVQSSSPTNEVLLSYWRKDDLTSQLSSLVMRNLTRDEWERYFPGKPYRKTLDALPPE